MVLVTRDGRTMYSMGELYYFNTTGTAVTIVAQSDGSTNMVKVAPSTTFTNFNDFDNGGSDDGTLRYTGTPSRDFHIACSISISPQTNNDIFVFAVALNGTPQDSSKVIMKAGTSTDTISSAMHVALQLDTNDELEFYVGNMSGTGNVTAKTLNLVAIAMKK